MTSKFHGGGDQLELYVGNFEELEPTVMEGVDSEISNMVKRQQQKRKRKKNRIGKNERKKKGNS